MLIVIMMKKVTLITGSMMYGFGYYSVYTMSQAISFGGMTIKSKFLLKIKELILKID